MDLRMDLRMGERRGVKNRMEDPHTAPYVSVPAAAASRCVVMAYLLLWRTVCATSVAH